MNEENNLNVEYIHDAYISMAERTIRRLWIVIILLSVIILVSIIGFLWYESQFEYIDTETYTLSQDVDGNGYITDGIHVK